MAERNELWQGENDLVRKMPASLSAERALLGSILIDPASITEILTLIRAEDFYVAEHKQIFLAMRELFEASREIDPVTLIDTLVHKGVYEKAGGEDYIRSLLEATPSAMNIADYARIVKEESTRRQIITLCAEVSDITYAEQEAVTAVLDYAQGSSQILPRAEIAKASATFATCCAPFWRSCTSLPKQTASPTAPPPAFPGWTACWWAWATPTLF